MNNSGGPHPAGHTVAGTFYLIWGLWWMIATFWTYFTPILHHTPKRRSRQQSQMSGLLAFFTHEENDPLVNKSWMPLLFLKQIPIEPIVKILLPGLGIIAETFFDVHPDPNGGPSKFVVFLYKVRLHHNEDDTWSFGFLTRLDHITLYLAFVISGIVDLLSYYLKLPAKTSQLFLCFSFATEWFIFGSHVHGRNSFNAAIHHNLSYFVISAGIFCALRMLNPRNLFINAGLAGSMILQGTHLLQAGWVLYGPTHFAIENDDNVKFISTATVWHLLGVSLFMLAVFLAMRFILVRCKKIKSSTLSHDLAEEESLIGNAEKIDKDTTELKNVSPPSSV